MAPYNADPQAASGWAQSSSAPPGYPPPGFSPNQFAAGFAQAPGPGVPGPRPGTSRSVVIAIIVLAVLFSTAAGLLMAKEFIWTTPPAVSTSSAPSTAQSAPAQNAPLADVIVASMDSGPGADPLMDEAFLQAMRDEPAFSTWADSDLFAAGESTCTVLDGGATVDDVLLHGMSLNLTPEDAGYLTGASIAAYCPQHAPLLSQWMGESTAPLT